MKIAVLNLVFIFFAPYIFCNKELLSKFHQNSFKLKDVRMELISYNKSYFYFFEIKPFKYNRTTTAHNATYRLKIDVEDKVELLMQDYKFLSNEYRHFPIRFQVNLKKAVNANALGLRGIINCGNLTTLYFKKDITYHICNYIPDETRFPPLVPNGKYKMEIYFLYLNLEIAKMAVYHEIYTPIDYPK